jgi:hypothetical protein
MRPSLSRSARRGIWTSRWMDWRCRRLERSPRGRIRRIRYKGAPDRPLLRTPPPASRQGRPWPSQRARAREGLGRRTVVRRERSPTERRPCLKHPELPLRGWTDARVRSRELVAFRGELEVLDAAPVAKGLGCFALNPARRGRRTLFFLHRACRRLSPPPAAIPPAGTWDSSSIPDKNTESVTDPPRLSSRMLGTSKTLWNQHNRAPSTSWHRPCTSPLCRARAAAPDPR